MSVTTTATIGSVNPAYVQRKGLDVAKPNLQYGNFGQKVTVPQGYGKQFKARRYEKFAPTTGKELANIRLLVEGATPSSVTPSITDITIAMSEYGFVTQFSSLTVWTNETSVDQELMARNSENMAETLDCVYRDGVMGGTNLQRLTDNVGGVSGAARANVGGIINAKMLDKVIRNLKGANAKPFKAAAAASTSIGTVGIRESYVGIIHTDVEYDLENVPGYTSVNKYPSQSGLYPGEVGNYHNIRFVTSTLATYYPDSGTTVAAVAGMQSTTGTNNDVYACLFLGMNAYAIPTLASSAKITYIPNTTPDKFDPLGQWHSLGWYAVAGAGILNQNWLLRSEVCASLT